MGEAGLRRYYAGVRFFFNVQKECLIEAVRIQRLNPCYGYEFSDEDDDHFNPADWVGKELIGLYGRQVICKDIQTFDYVTATYCKCKFAKFEVFNMVEAVRNDIELKRIKSK